MNRAPRQHRIPGTPRAGRWLVVGVASLLLHWLAILWVSGNLRMPSLHEQSDTMITAALHPAPADTAPALPAAGTAPTKQAPGARPHPLHPTPATPADQAPAVETVATQTDAGMEAPGTSIEPAAALPATETQTPQPIATDNTSDMPQEQAGVHYKVSPPPSVELKYDVKKVSGDGNPLHGHGTISWHSNGTSYVIHGDAGVLFITALTFTSEGTIDEFGVAPVIYSEKRFRKSATNTHFHRQRNTISFSASETSYPRKGGEQDRASIIWQLSSIGRGDSEKFMPDAAFDIFVAGVRDGEIWRIHVIGQEDIETGLGKTATWHVVRAPKSGSYDQKLDIWLTPQHEWYPARLRYTETNGDTLDMLLSDMRDTSAR